MIISTWSFALLAFIIFLAGSAFGICIMIVALYIRGDDKRAMADAEEWALRMKDRHRMDLTVDHGIYGQELTPEQLAEFKKNWEALGDGKLRVVKS